MTSISPAGDPGQSPDHQPPGPGARYRITHRTEYRYSDLVTSSATDQETLSCATVCRWGDYAAASPDPSSSTLVWGSNQYNGPASSGATKKLGWKTRNFAITP